MPELPVAAPPEELKRQQRLRFNLSSHAVDGQAFRHEPYTLFKDGAPVQRGVTDALGQLFVDDHVEGTSRYQVRFGVGTTFDLHVRDALDPTSSAAQLSNQGFRSVGTSGAADAYGSTTRDI